MTQTAAGIPIISLLIKSTQKLLEKKLGTVAMIITKYERRIARRRPQFVKNLEPIEPIINPRIAAVDMYVLFLSA